MLSHFTCMLYWRLHLHEMHAFTTKGSFQYIILLSKRIAQCYLCDETEGSRGANEIACAILSYLHKLPHSVRHFTSFSDTGADRN